MLAAIPVLKAYSLPTPTATEVLNTTGASRTTAYKVRGAIQDAMPTLLRPVGRPPTPPAPRDADALLVVASKVRDFLFDHPGCVGGALRRTYSEGFHLFALDLFQEHSDLPVETLADVMGVPLGTAKEWLRGERPHVDAPQAQQVASDPEVATSRIETVLDAWSRWDGRFRPFCKHVQFHLRIPFPRMHISDLLEAHGVRIPARRGRDRDASALRRGFETFFPGAQWVGDGTELVVTVAEQRFKVNLELLVDTHSGAFTGASIRATEDAAAVTEAFHDGVDTAGQAPLAVLLDNKPSNHGDEVDEALGDTLRMRSRPYVPTDKPHVEGAFGLFQQEAPTLALLGTTPAQQAAELARLIVMTWGRAINHRPRLDRGGTSRVSLYRNAAPTEEEIARAREALKERQRKQTKARETQARRQDPVTRARLDAAFQRLALDDPDGHLRDAIASWPLDAVLEGIATFEGKKRANTLPEGADGRYLRGIVKNIAQEREGWEIAQALLRERLAARDQVLEHLGRQREVVDEEVEDPEDAVKRYVGKALEARRGIDRTFWLLATVDVVAAVPQSQRTALLRLAARRIHATFAVPHAERLAATRFLFAKAAPVD